MKNLEDEGYYKICEAIFAEFQFYMRLSVKMIKNFHTSFPLSLFSSPFHVIFYAVAVIVEVHNLSKPLNC